MTLFIASEVICWRVLESGEATATTKRAQFLCFNCDSKVAAIELPFPPLLLAFQRLARRGVPLIRTAKSVNRWRRPKGEHYVGHELEGNCFCLLPGLLSRNREVYWNNSALISLLFFAEQQRGT